VRIEFDARFWPQYPNKVGKPKAFEKYEVARRKVAELVILEGLDRYVRKTDDRPWCNPATWLHQERWADEPSVRPPPKAPRMTYMDAVNEIIEEKNRERSSSNGHRGDALLLPAALARPEDVDRGMERSA